MGYDITVYPGGIEFDYNLSPEKLQVSNGDKFVVEISDGLVYLKRIEN